MPKLAEGNAQVTAVVPEDLVEWLDEVASKNERSRSWVIAHALEHYRAAADDNGYIKDPAALGYELTRSRSN